MAELVATLQVLLKTRQLLISDAMRRRGVLVRELESFRAAPPVLRGDAVESWRECDHDDLVLVVALALWVATVPPVIFAAPAGRC